MLMGRMFSYPDTHRYRIGPNYKQLPVNAPRAPVHTYEIDGPMRYRHSGPEPTYAPNSHGGPQADPRRAAEPSWWSDAAELGRHAYERHAGDDDFGQAGALVRDVMTHGERDNLVDNIVDHLSQGVSAPIQDRAIDYWTSVDAPLGERIALGLGRPRRAAA
jgi:catalase